MEDEVDIVQQHKPKLVVIMRRRGLNNTNKTSSVIISRDKIEITKILKFEKKIPQLEHDLQKETVEKEANVKQQLVRLRPLHLADMFQSN